MKLSILVVGRLKESYFKAAEAEYLKRLRPYATVAVVEAKDDAKQLAAIPDGALVFALDERGEQLTSAQFADVLANEGSHGGGRPVVFAIGGADGHSAEVRARADRLFAFGRATIAHRLVRLILLEQIYRSFKILRGEPYHRD